MSRWNDWSISVKESYDTGISILKIGAPHDTNDEVARFLVEGAGTFDFPITFLSGDKLNITNVPKTPEAKATILHPWSASENKVVYFTHPGETGEVDLVYSVSPHPRVYEQVIQPDLITIREVEA